MNSIRYASRIRFHLGDLNSNAKKHEPDEDLFPFFLIRLSAVQGEYVREAMAMRKDIFNLIAFVPLTGIHRCF